MTKSLLTYDFAEPLGEAQCARIEIEAAEGNLVLGKLSGDEGLLARGTLQYFEKQGPPSRSLAASDGQASFSLKGRSAGKPWYHFPWSACNGATEWRIDVNPSLPCEINAHSGGGNLHLDLAEVTVTSLSARTGGGNVKIELGGDITGRSAVKAGSGAGNVEVSIPDDLAARIHATTGWGKVLINPRFQQVESHVFQSPDYDESARHVEIEVSSGAGNVSVESREN